MELIEHYIEEHDTLFHIPLFEAENEDQLLANDYDLVQDAIACAVANMAHLGYDEIPAFAIRDSIFNIKKEEFEERKQTCLDHYAKLEDYDTCQALSELSLK